MTCIVGLVHEGKVWIGADSAGSTEDFTAPRKDPKVFKLGQYGIAYTESFRMGDILHYGFKPPKFDPNKMPLEKFIRTKFIFAVKGAFVEGGYGKIDSSSQTASDKGGCFIVGIAGRLFNIGTDFQVGEYLHSYCADGSGYAYAYGSFFSTEGLNPKDRVKMALKASAEFTPSVGGPFRIISI